MSLELGTLDGRVELRELLGQGGMGEVYAAWDRALQRAVAVKFVRGSDPRDAERLLLEARLQARVEHPHVVRVFEVGTLGGRPCIVFQLVQGRPLDVLAPTLTLAERVEMVRQAATGLHAAHLQGLVHRDVKPGNVLVETPAEGVRTAYVTDFGLAHAEGGGLTRSGILPGTLDFMAPEQVAGAGPADFRSDVYALGATLYAVVAGQPPFRRSSPDADESGEAQVRLLRRILDEEPPPLASLAPDAPRELAVIAAKAMDKEPSARYATADAFAEDLARFQRGEPIRARPPTTLDRATRWVRRNRTASRAIAAALATLVVAGGLALWQARQAGVEALNAARLGAQAASLESRLRMEYLSPAHDLRPALTAVRAEVEALRPLAARPRGGPGSFALGKGLELLGELDEAKAAYQRAWALGFRTPAVAEGLGTVLGRIYQREYASAAAALSHDALAARHAELRRDLQEPARRALEQGDVSGWRGPFLRAQLALLEGDFAAARARAAEVLAIDPGRYEARILEGEAWLGEAMLAQARDRQDDSMAALARGAPSLESAIVVGRSDVRAHRLLAETLGHRVKLLVAAGRDPVAAFDAALQAFERAAALDPDDPALLLGRGRAMNDRVHFEAMLGHRSALQLSAEAAALLRRAAQGAPRDPAPLQELAAGLSYRSILVQEWLGASPADEVAEGLAATDAALRLAPGQADVVRSRATLLLAQARSQQALGQDARPALEELEARCSEAERLDPKRAPAVRAVLLQGLWLRAQQEWRWGADPRPTFERAVALGERLLADSRERLSAGSQLSTLLVWYALMLVDMGGDPATQTARALALAEHDLAEHPKLAAARFLKGQYLVVEGLRRTDVGTDASQTLREARALITSATAGQAAMSDLGETLGLLGLLEARDLASRGGDPSAALDRCERGYRAAAAEARQNPAGPKGLAACALERARWLSRRPGPAAATAAARAQAQVARALELDPHDPTFAIVQARLQVLAGDREAGRQTLAKAYEAQPLLRGNRAAKAAEAELAASR